MYWKNIVTLIANIYGCFVLESKYLFILIKVSQTSTSFFYEPLFLEQLVQLNHKRDHPQLIHDNLLQAVEARPVFCFIGERTEVIFGETDVV